MGTRAHLLQFVSIAAADCSATATQSCAQQERRAVAADHAVASGALQESAGARALATSKARRCPGINHMLMNCIYVCGSVKGNSDLRSQFFLHNAEFASTIPFVLEHIVPNSVDIAIAESVDGALPFARICTALTCSQRRRRRRLFPLFACGRRARCRMAPTRRTCLHRLSCRPSRALFFRAIGEHPCQSCATIESSTLVPCIGCVASVWWPRWARSPLAEAVAAVAVVVVAARVHKPTYRPSHSWRPSAIRSSSDCCRTDGIAPDCQRRRASDLP